MISLQITIRADSSDVADVLSRLEAALNVASGLTLDYQATIAAMQARISDLQTRVYTASDMDALAKLKKRIELIDPAIALKPQP